VTFNDAYKKYRSYLIRRARSSIRVDDAEDAVQRAYLVWLEADYDIKSPRRFLNRCLTLIMHKYYRQYRGLLFQSHPEACSHDDMLDFTRVREDVTQHMRSLTPRLREAMTLKAQGYSPRETAKLMGLKSPKTASLYWWRAQLK
jgi:DNA-directed RNA polymerase specialized sigma24 family protein